MRVEKVLFWILVSILFGYSLLKAVGFIESPQIIDVVPSITVGGIAILLYQLISTEIKEMRSDLNNFQSSVNKEFGKIC